MKHILILGAGSVGKRHLRNFSALGCRVSALDPRMDRLEEAGKETPLVGSYRNLAEALRDVSKVDGVVVASPPKFHVEQCLAFLSAGKPVFLEKPVSIDSGPARILAEAVKGAKNIPLLLGYTYRWWPPLRELRNRLHSGEIGKPLHARFVMSAHLADWHPWEQYQEFFMASKELGGGALLDESHFLDLMLWFFGMPESLWAKVAKISDLEIQTDDLVDMTAMYPGMQVNMHLDLFGRPHEKFIVITGEKGTLQWSFDPNRILSSETAEAKWKTSEFSVERNHMFLEAAREFLQVLDGAPPTCTAGDGFEVMRLVDACRLSSASGKTVRLAEIG